MALFFETLTEALQAYGYHLVKAIEKDYWSCYYYNGATVLAFHFDAREREVHDTLYVGQVAVDMVKLLTSDQAIWPLMDEVYGLNEILRTRSHGSAGNLKRAVSEASSVQSAIELFKEIETYAPECLDPNFEYKPASPMAKFVARIKLYRNPRRSRG